MKNFFLSSFAKIAAAMCIMTVASSLEAATLSTVTYQGQMLVEGEKFTGTGKFKFAFVDAGTENNVQATANAAVTSGFITSISVNNAGSGYVSTPTVTITDGTGTGATATATVAGGVVTSITVNNAGSGYSLSPTVTVDPPPSNLDYVTFWSNDGTSIDGSEPTDSVTVNINDGLFIVGLGDGSLANMMALPSSIF